MHQTHTDDNITHLGGNYQIVHQDGKNEHVGGEKHSDPTVSGDSHTKDVHVDGNKGGQLYSGCPRGWK
jgi:hypothetical protein